MERAKYVPVERRFNLTCGSEPAAILYFSMTRVVMLWNDLGWQKKR